ncbi:hypothetical protein HQ447_10880 [bacterium]|nr:hypothetical protein [bacterium]
MVHPRPDVERLKSGTLEADGQFDGLCHVGYPTTPATLIGRLARSLDAPGTGGLLLADALKRILASSVEVASALVVVEAKGSEAVAFYQKFGFIVFKDKPRKLFLPMQTIAAAAR